MRWAEESETVVEGGQSSQEREGWRSLGEGRGEELSICQKSRCKGPEARGWPANLRNNQEVEMEKWQCAACNPKGKENNNNKKIPSSFFFLSESSKPLENAKGIYRYSLPGLCVKQHCIKSIRQDVNDDSNKDSTQAWLTNGINRVT